MTMTGKECKMSLFDRFPKPYFETDRDGDFYERRAESRDERNREDLIEKQGECVHRIIKNGRCHFCLKLVDVKSQ